MNRNSLIAIIIIWLMIVNIPISEGYTSQDQIDTHPTRSDQNYSFPMYKGDLQRTGRCNINTSDNPGMVIWKYDIGTGNIQSSPVIGPDGVIYMGDAYGRFHAVYPNGTRKWLYSARTPIEGEGAISDDGIVYFGTYNEYFYSLWASNGTKRWSIDIGGVWGSPLILLNGTIIVNGVDKGLCMINSDGKILWSKWIGVGYSSPAVRHDGIIVIGSQDDYLYAMYPNGTIKWKFQTGYTTSTPAVDSNDNTYVTSWSGFLYSVDPNGTERWEKYLPGPVNNNFLASPAIDHEENIICLTPGGQICKYGNNGSVIWKTHTWGYTWDSPVIDSESNIYYTTDGSDWGGLYSNRTVKLWDLIGASITAPAIGKNGTIYVTGGSGILYAIGKKSPETPLLSLKEEGDEYISLNWSYPEETGLPMYSDIPLPPELMLVNIFRNRTGTEPQLLTTINLSKDNSSEYRDEDVINGIEYTYSITSVSIYGESKRGNEVTATPITIPGPPLNLKAVEGNGYVILSWEPPNNDGGGGILRYSIYRRQIGETFQQLADADPSILYYNDTGAVNGIVYEYYIHAVNLAGLSQPGSIIAGPRTVPDNPTLNVKSGDSEVTLTWEDPGFDGGSEILGFRIYKKNDNNQENLITELGNDIHDYIDKDVINGNEYHYMVTAFNEIGESISSLFYKVIPKGIPTSPLSLSGRSGNGFVHLSWTEPLEENGSPIVYYLIEVEAVVQGEQFKESYLIDLPSNEYNDTNVNNGFEYTYTVMAANSIGESLPSNSITVKPSSIPSIPRNLTYQTGDSYISLSWLKPEMDGGLPISGYQIYRQKDLLDFELLIELNEISRTYNDTTVENEIMYSYYIVSLNDNGPSDPSQMVNGVPTKMITVPSEPLGLTYAVGEDFVLLSWDSPGDNGGSSLVEYRIYRGTTSDSISFYRSINATITEFNDTDVEPGSFHFYYVTCTNEKGESVNTSSISVSTLDESSDLSNGNIGVILIIIIAIVFVLSVILTFLFLIKNKRKAIFERNESETKEDALEEKHTDRHLPK